MATIAHPLENQIAPAQRATFAARDRHSGFVPGKKHCSLCQIRQIDPAAPGPQNE
jgi:hypothetical protein